MKGIVDSILFFVRFSISEMFANRKKLSRYRMYEEKLFFTKA